MRRWRKCEAHAMSSNWTVEEPTEGGSYKPTLRSPRSRERLRRWMSTTKDGLTLVGEVGLRVAAAVLDAWADS